MSAKPAGTDLSRYDQCLARHSAWLTANQAPDGTFRDAGPAITAYMPMPVYGQAMGRQDLVDRACQTFETRFIRNGELIQPDSVRELMPYIPGWLVMGATLNERLQLRAVMLKHLLSFQDPATGGFFGSVDARAAGRGVIDFDSSTNGCAALCIAGSDAAALRAGQYLRKLIEAQPDPKNRLYLQWDSARGLIREFDPKQVTPHLLVYAERKQHLYKIGLLSRAFAHLYGMTGDAAWLELAERQYALSIAPSPDVWSNTLAHKLSWAAWTIFRLNGKQRYIDDACRMADHLLTIQQADGGFFYPELFPTYAEMPRPYALNIGTQFATWIHYARIMARF